MSVRYAIHRLTPQHRIEDFTCGRESLDRYLVRHALAAQQSSAAQTRVACEGDRVVGYYTLVFGQVAPDHAPARVAKGQPRHPIPLMLLARLAVATEKQGQGLGAGLLKDALARTLAAAEIAGLRAFAVHAKDDQARSFYERFDFVASPSDPMHLFVLLKDVRAMLA
jgi:predicted N-acetyltransferase YhbS